MKLKPVIKKRREKIFYILGHIFYFPALIISLVSVVLLESAESGSVCAEEAGLSLVIGIVLMGLSILFLRLGKFPFTDPGV